jgi:hypothetical protein
MDRMRRPVLMEQFYHDIGWEADRARCQLLLAEVACRQGDRDQARRQLEAASAWILHSGSVEHLCLLHLQRARLARQLDRDGAAARRALDEGVHLARQCGLGLYLIDLLCEEAEVLLTAGDLSRAEAVAQLALLQAAAPGCQFLWGAAQAGHLLGQALAAQQRGREARAVLRKALARRTGLNDPRAAQTEELLRRL